MLAECGGLDLFTNFFYFGNKKDRLDNPIINRKLNHYYFHGRTTIVVFDLSENLSKVLIRLK